MIWLDKEHLVALLKLQLTPVTFGYDLEKSGLNPAP